MGGRLHKWTLILAVVIAGAGCKKIFNPTAGRVISIDANLDSLYKVEGGLQDARYTAYFQQSEVQRIDEKPYPNDPNGPERCYYFRSNDLFYYREKTPRVETHFFVDEKGVLTKAERIEDGQTAALNPEAVPPVQLRAAELKLAAAARAGKSLGLPLLRNR